MNIWWPTDISSSDFSDPDGMDPTHQATINQASLRHALRLQNLGGLLVPVGFCGGKGGMHA